MTQMIIMSRLSTIHRQDDIGRHENPPASPFLRSDGPRAWEPALLRGLDKAEIHSIGLSGDISAALQKDHEGQAISLLQGNGVNGLRAQSAF